MKFLSFFTLVSVLLLISCNNKASESKNLVTKRIQYDVSIVNKDADFDWWVQNIEGADREALIADILNAAASGKVIAYDYLTLQPLEIKQINSILKRTDTVAVESPNPPYDIVDSVITSVLNRKDIEKIRFLEEWQMDKKSLSFTKTVAGICPMIAKYGDNGDFRGYMPLFWVFFDEKYPEALK